MFCVCTRVFSSSKLQKTLSIGVAQHYYIRNRKEKQKTIISLEVAEKAIFNSNLSSHCSD